jgi:predicted  nucleic acid-binding Zn-ribbon protein
MLGGSVPVWFGFGESFLDEKVIDTLVSLQAIDQRRRDKTLEIEGLRKQTSEVTAERDLKKSEADAIRSDADETNVRRRELEAVLSEEERRLKDRRMRLTRIRTEKEHEAAQREIDGLKELSSRHEEELITLIEQAESVDGGLQAADEVVAEVQARLDQLETESRGRIEQLEREIEADAGEREAIAEQLKELDVRVMRRYTQIFERRDGLAVVEMVRDLCCGCNMAVPPQMANEIRKGQGLHQCPSCQRMLYWRLDGEEATAG